mgnify:CR=1 FL=1
MTEMLMMGGPFAPPLFRTTENPFGWPTGTGPRLALRVPGGGLAALRLVPDGIDGPLRRALAAIPVIQALVELVPGQVHFQHSPVQVVEIAVLRCAAATIRDIVRDVKDRGK